jgi:hypothetical protein
LAHTLPEIKANRMVSTEDHRLIAPEHYRIETAIGRNLHLAVACDLRFHPLLDNVKMVKFDLLPDMQVARLSLDGKEIPFVQESRKQDGSFYVVMPQPLVRYHAYHLVFEYEGGEMIRDMGGKLYTILPRQPWYPRPSTVSMATYDLTFKHPRDMTVIATGDRVKMGAEDGQITSEWISNEPVPMAGFNYGLFFEKPRVDESNGFPLEAYLGSKAQGFFQPSSALGLDRAENSIRIFSHWFGEPPFEHLAVSESNMSDSFPGLLFVPTIMMTDTSERVSRINIARRGRGGAMPPAISSGPVFDESLAREVARQWWGNSIAPASFHDEWLVRGLADMSGSLYDMVVEPERNNFHEHWRRAHDLLLTKTFWGVRETDAAPVWLGTMADPFLTQRSGPAYAPPGSPLRVTFARPYISPSTALTGMKGGFILHMLRGVMFDAAKGDADFIAMMHDFTSQFAHRTVSTEQFQFVVERHMKPTMDLEGNKKMDWFFREWVYGTELPTYHLEYVVKKGEAGGKPTLEGKLTQSGVSESFRMPVPVYVKLGSKTVIAGHMDIVGNRTAEFKVILPEEPKKVFLNANYDVLCEVK